MDQILERLYLGDAEDARNATPAHCQAILTLCEDAAKVHDGIYVTHLPIADGIYHFPQTWNALLQVLHTMMGQYNTVLVHCRLGKSRSPALMAAYLARTGWYDPESALAYVKKQRELADPLSETWRSVLAWWNTKLR